VLPEKDEDAANLLVLSTVICLGMSALTLLLVSLFRTTAVNLFGVAEIAHWLWFMPLSLLVTGLFQALNYWSIRRKHFKILAARQITQSSSTAFLQVASGLIFTNVSSGLIGGSIAGQAIATGRLAWQIEKDEGLRIQTYIKKNIIKSMVSRYRNFPIFSAWSALLNKASVMLPALLLGYFFDPVIVGYYALGQRVLSLPAGVVGDAVARVFFPRAIDAQNQGNLQDLAIKILRILLKIGFTPIAILTVIAPQMFASIFGSQWQEAGVYMQWLSMWLLFVLVFSPMSNLFLVLERQRTALVFDIILFTTRLLALIIGGSKGDPLLTIILLGITGAILPAYKTVWILLQLGTEIKKVIKVFFDNIVFTLPFVFTLFLIKQFSANNILSVLAAFALLILFTIIIYRELKFEVISI
jgi:O-antigen/teichoic acid export membrane protein